MSYNINETFIIQTVDNADPTFTACTGVYSNAILSCSGNTSILLGSGTVSVIGDIFTNNNVNANTITAINYFSGSTQLSDVIDSKSLTGGTYNGQTLSLGLKNGSNISISGFTDIFVTGGTYSAGSITLINNTGGTFTINGLFTGNTDVFVTGGTYNSNTGIATFTNNTGGTFTVNNFYTGATDVFVTGGTYSNGSATFRNNTGGTFTINGFYTGATDVFVTGGTYSNGNILFINNTGGTFNVTGLFTGNTDVFVTGGTYNSNTGIATFTNNTGGTFTVNGFYTGATDVFVTGGTYNSNTGIATFINNTGGTFTLSGFTSQNNVSNDYLPLSGGTVSGNTIFTSGLTANTINLNNYIDFSSGTTNPLSVGGRVFFDNTSKALSYYDIQGANIPIAMGQQLYTRVYNVTGSQINKGKVIAITGTSNGLPSAILAVNTHAITSDRPFGVAAENIQNNSEGLVLNNGILSGITLNTFSNGDVLYLSDTIAGDYIATTSSLSLTARTNEIGYVLETGTTNGKIYVNIHNEDSNLSLTTKERNILEGNVISGGVYEYTGITQGTGATINVGQTRGWIVKNTYDYATLPDVTNIYYTGGTNIQLANLATADSTFILINSASTLVQQTSFPTPQQRRQNIFLGKVVHPSRTSITSINQTVDFDVSPMAAIRDLWTPLKLVNQGILVSPHSTTLEINTSSGVLWGNGVGWVTNQENPNSVSISGTSPTTFQYRTRLGPVTGVTAPYTGNTTLIDPAHYDNNGVVTNIGGGSNASTNQRVYLFPTGLVRIQYGQQVYSNLAAAVAASQTETFNEYSLNRDNGILIGIISVKKSATNLSNTAQAVFNFVSKFGENFGGTGGLSTTTLQQAYDNSTTPEIDINSTLGALTIKNGTGNADSTTHLLEGQNTAGSTTSFITAAGGFSGSSVSATTYYGLPTDVYVTGSTYSNNTFTFTNNTGGTFNTLFNTVTGLTVNGSLFSNILSATTYQNLPKDIFVTGGTYSAGTAEFTNNSGGTFSVTGFSTSTGGADIFITGGTYANGITTFINNTGGTFTISGYQDGLAYSGESFLIVTVGSNQVTNGNNLKAAYTYATTRTPYGGALSNSNRYSIILQPGVYDIGSTTFTLSNNFIDLIGLSSDPNLSVIYSSGATVVTLGSITNYRLKNLTIENNANTTARLCIGGVNTTTRSNEEWDNIVFKYGPNAGVNTRIHDNNFTFSGRYSQIKLLTLAVGVGSTYPTDHVIMNLFSATGTTVAGTLSGLFNNINLVCLFPNSSSIFNCITYNLFNATTLSGAFTNVNYNTFTEIGAANPVYPVRIDIGGLSTSITGIFNNINVVTRHSNYPVINIFGVAGATVSGTFKNIDITNLAQINGFGGNINDGGANTTSGYFEDISCFGTSVSFGTETASGRFLNCIMTSSSAINRSFGGGSSGNASGEFINCTAISTGAGANASFGGNQGGFSGSNTASGRFINCMARSNSGGMTSFGGFSHGSATGVFINCEATTVTGTEQRTFGGSSANGFSGTGLRINKTGQWTARVSGYVRDSEFIALGANQSAITQIQNNAKLTGIRAISTGSGLSLNATTTVSASTYLCAFNTTPFSGITNFVTTPYNVIDANI